MVPGLKRQVRFRDQDQDQEKLLLSSVSCKIGTLEHYPFSVNDKC